MGLKKFLVTEKERELFLGRTFHDLFSSVANVQAFIDAFGVAEVSPEKTMIVEMKKQLEMIIEKI